MSQRYIHSSILEIGVYHYHCVVATVAKPGAIDSYLHFLASLIVGTNKKIATVSARTRSNLLFSCVVSFFIYFFDIAQTMICHSILSYEAKLLEPKG